MLLLSTGMLACVPKSPSIPGPLGSLGRPAPTHRLGGDKLDGGDDGELPTPGRARRSGSLGQRIADAARHYLESAPRGFRDDCSGFVEASLAHAGLPLSGNTSAFWELSREAGYTHHRKIPRPGDLAFFDNTWDRNGNDRLDDELSHIAIVLEVDGEGTITLAHAGTSSGRSILTMNLSHPSVREIDGGQVVNSYLRRKTPEDSARTRYLSGELWRGFATLRSDAVAQAD
ncbi:MAG TPA: CHAP domain-containing protein [Deltaproteobacteria bacterium]|nr:CHAP domain-containing protein [Deltaproteobacteria bacterium]